MLYESDLRGSDAGTTLTEHQHEAEHPFNDYTGELVAGVTDNAARIDEILLEFAEGWSLERMPALDRAVLRIAIYELLWRADVPDAVVIDEAVELAKTFSTDESPRYVNGVLARVMRERPSVSVSG